MVVWGWLSSKLPPQGAENLQRIPIMMSTDSTNTKCSFVLCVKNLFRQKQVPNRADMKLQKKRERWTVKNLLDALVSIHSSWRSYSVLTAKQLLPDHKWLIGIWSPQSVFQCVCRQSQVVHQISRLFLLSGMRSIFNVPEKLFVWLSELRRLFLVEAHTHRFTFEILRRNEIFTYPRVEKK